MGKDYYCFFLNYDEMRRLLPHKISIYYYPMYSQHNVYTINKLLFFSYLDLRIVIVRKLSNIHNYSYILLFTQVEWSSRLVSQSRFDYNFLLPFFSGYVSTAAVVVLSHFLIFISSCCCAFSRNLSS